MRAAVFGDAGEISVVEREASEPRPGWVRLAVSAVALHAITAHRDQAAALVTHRFKLDQVAEAFATAADKFTHSIKVQIEP